MNNRIKDLQRQIELEQKRIDNCNHEFGETYDNHEIQKEEYHTGQYERQGVHSWPITEFRDKRVPRWSKKCKICGYEKHTYKTKPIVIGNEPDF